MKTRGYTATTAVIIFLALLCAGICGWQTAQLISWQDTFAAEHPDYVSHSWILLTDLAVTVLLAWGQAVLRRRKGNPLLCGVMSAATVVLGVLILRAAADQHYHMGILISDYGIEIPFEGGWLLLVLAALLLLATAAQLLTVLFSVLIKRTDT